MAEYVLSWESSFTPPVSLLLSLMHTFQEAKPVFPTWTVTGGPTTICDMLCQLQALHLQDKIKLP